MDRLGPDDLTCFLVIAAHGSFRRAAAEVGLTPSALSHALRALEERVGVRLVNRTTRSVALTEAGRQLHARVAPAWRDIHDAIDDLNRFRGRPMGTLRINVARAAAQLVLLPTVTRFLAACPEVRVEIVVDNALADIVAGGFDFGVRFGESLAADMIATPIGPRHRFAVVGSPGYLARHPAPRTPHELRTLPCIRHRFLSGVLYRWEFERGGEAFDVEVEGPLTVSDQDLVVQAALDGLGLAYAFEGQVTELLAQGRLVRVLEDWCPYYPGFFLYYPSRRQLPAAAKAFVAFVRAEGAK